MDRRVLDAIVAHHELEPAAVEAALDVCGARPSTREIRQFATRLLQLAGMLWLAVGVVLLANRQDLSTAARLALAQLAVVASVAVAIWKPPPQPLGRYALLLAFIATGALLALFGRIYQTGADMAELFLAWAVLGLPFVVAARWPVAYAAWLVVLNPALLTIFSYPRPPSAWFFVMLPPWNVSRSVLLLAPTVLNLVLWMLVEYLRRARPQVPLPRWIARLTLAYAFAFATWAGLSVVGQSSIVGDNGLTLLVVLGLEAAIVVYAVKLRGDAFPLALVAASLIVLVARALHEHAGFSEFGAYVALALWLVVSSTVSGRALMSLVRAWSHREQPA